MNKRRNIILLLAVLLSIRFSYAQQVRVVASVDTNTIKIGEQITLSLTVANVQTNSTNQTIRWPEIVDTLSSTLEVVSQLTIDTLNKNTSGSGLITLQKQVVITSFEQGLSTIPSLMFIIQGDTLMTTPITINVGTVKVDLNEEIKDIKTVLDVEYTFWDWLNDNKYMLIIVWLLLAVFAIIIYFLREWVRKNKKMERVVAPEVRLPAHVIAISKLEDLKNEKLWQQGKVKQYYIQLTEILREYVENRFRIQALEQTTEEILIGFRSIAIDEESKRRLKQVLILSDLVKFAKEQPLQNENELSLDNAYEFIHGTKQDEVTTNA